MTTITFEVFESGIFVEFTVQTADPGTTLANLYALPNTRNFQIS